MRWHAVMAGCFVDSLSCFVAARHQLLVAEAAIRLHFFGTMVRTSFL